jgi:hypothetical protein
MRKNQLQISVFVFLQEDVFTYLYHRYRTYEAFSGCDLDPVHVSDYHQVPYATLFPALTKNVLYTGWAEVQESDGMIQVGWLVHRILLAAFSDPPPPHTHTHTLAGTSFSSPSSITTAPTPTSTCTDNSQRTKTLLPYQHARTLRLHGTGGAWEHGVWRAHHRHNGHVSWRSHDERHDNYFYTRHISGWCGPYTMCLSMYPSVRVYVGVGVGVWV